ncbi:hypothetical protein BH09ACT12_BH09ACT12_36230 [soil metagenome]
MLHGLPRRSTAIAAGVLLLAGALSSCGFDTATNRINTISSGINDQDGQVDILGAAIISGASDSGLFVATLSNSGATDGTVNDTTVTLVDLAGDVTPIDDLTPVPIEPSASDSLYQDGGIAVSGSFELGDFVNVQLTFDNGQTSTLEVAVMRPCYEYDPAKFPGMVLPSASTEPTDEVTESSTEDSADSEAGSEATDPYSCTPISAEPHSEGE